MAGTVKTTVIWFTARKWRTALEPSSTEPKSTGAVPQRLETRSRIHVVSQPRQHSGEQQKATLRPTAAGRCRNRRTAREKVTVKSTAACGLSGTGSAGPLSVNPTPATDSTVTAAAALEVFRKRKWAEAAWFG